MAIPTKTTIVLDAALRERMEGLQHNNPAWGALSGAAKARLLLESGLGLHELAAQYGTTPDRLIQKLEEVLGDR